MRLHTKVDKEVQLEASSTQWAIILQYFAYKYLNCVILFPRVVATIQALPDAIKEQVKLTNLHMVLDCKISSAQCEIRNVALHLLLTPNAELLRY